MVTIDGLIEYLGGTDVPADLLEDFLISAASRLPAMVTDVAAVPTETADLAVYSIAAELIARRNATGGVISVGADGAVSRLAADPTKHAQSILADYLAWPIA